jgi:hypothetical protein
MLGSEEMVSALGENSALRCGHCTLGIQLNARLGGSKTGPGRFGVAKNPFYSTENVATIHLLSRPYPCCYTVCHIPAPNYDTVFLRY